LPRSISPHLQGLLLTAFGVLVLSPDALLLRMLQADHWTVVFWRGVLMSFTLVAVMTVLHRGHPLAAFRAVGRWGLVSSVVYGLSSALFVYSITHTAAANTLVIIAGTPLVAAIMSRVLLGERVAPETWIATAAVIGGIALVVSEGLQRGTWDGDLAAFGVTFVQAANFTLLRHRKHVNMVPATALGGLWAALGTVVLGLAEPLAVPAADIPVLAVLGLFVVPVAFGLITIGPRYITAPEVGLLMLLETVLGPLWVWLALGERAGTLALLGGGLVVITLGVYFAVRLRRQGVRAPVTA
jgi:drug/metabolite transporter (DMT)-like permease